MWNKRGQFFLIAALVISGILIGFATFYTSTQSPQEDTTVYDLSSELNYENAQVIDQGVFNNLPQDQINAHITNLTNYYATQNPTTDFTILVGTGDQIILIQCLERNRGVVSASTGGSSTGTSVRDNRCGTLSAPRASSNTPGAVGDVVTLVATNGATITIPISPAQNSFIVLGSKRGNQQYSATTGFPTNNQFHECSGSEPSDPSSNNGIIKGSESYSTGYTPISWTFTQFTSTLSQSSIGACKWSCNYLSGYVRDGTTNHCKRS